METITPETKKQSPSRKPNWVVIISLGLLVLIFLSIAGLGVANAVVDGQYQGKIEPGISISGVYVGEMTRDEARAALQKNLQGYSDRPIVLEFQDKKWQPTLEQLGVSISVESSLDKAFSMGKNGDFFKDLRLVKLMNPEAHNLPLEVMLNEAKLRGYLSDISDRIRLDPVEPNVELRGTEVIATEGKVGFNVEYEKTFEAIKNSLVTLKPGEENLLKVGDVAPTISQPEYLDFKNRLTAMVATPVVVNFKDKTWSFDQKQIAGMIKVERSLKKTDPKHFSYSVDKSSIEKFVKGLEPTVNQQPKNGEIGWDNGKVIAKAQSQDGQTLIVDRSIDDIYKQIMEPTPENRSVTLTVDVKQPEIDTSNLDKLGLKEVIGEGVSLFAGSAWERAENIKVGAKWLNGKFIKPHSVFSFLDAVGEINAARGFVKGYAIMADQTVPEIGGGICQVSTTTFRAAFYAGLPIVERHAHVYRVSWYEELKEPVGFDAAVYQPGVDMKFENNTDNWMYLEAFIKDGKLQVRLWGTKVPGQTVELKSNGINNVTKSPPDRYEIDKSLGPLQRKQVDYARNGLSTTITRVIMKDGQPVKEDKFPTIFSAWPNIYKLGPAFALPDGKVNIGADGRPATVATTTPPTTAAPTTGPQTAAPTTQAPANNTPAPTTAAPAPTTQAPPPTTKKP